MQKPPYRTLSSSPSQKPRSRWGQIFSLLILILILGVLAVEVWRPRTWQDYYARLHYQPGVTLSSIIDKISFTSRGRNIFLATRPTISEATEFNEQCARREATVSILGCYDNQDIYIYRVSEPKLNGITETTAAHELLHAAYARLNYFERPEVDKMLRHNYEQIKTPDLEERLDYYRRIDPESIANELHSILGTEILQLTDDLEGYYARYFTNRQLVVGFYQQYHQQFVDLSNHAAELKQQIDALLTEIITAQNDYATRLALLNSEIDQFNQRAESSFYSSQTQFNRDRQLLLNKINANESRRQQINQKVNDYNQLIEEYNSNATQYQKLNQSLDSLSQTPTL